MIDLKSKIQKEYNFLNGLFDKLYPMHRTIVGEGYNKSLSVLDNFFKFKFNKFKTGERVFDWIVPKSFKVNDAYILTPNGKKICQFKKNNLHLVNNSIRVKKTLNLSQLKKILVTLKNNPKAVPFSFSYYKKKYGFCISYDQYKKLKSGNYKINIDTSFQAGSMFVAEKTIKSKNKKSKTFLLTSYLCHPSMANNELSGPLVLLALYQRLNKWNNRNLNYKFLINPETIGSIFYINKFLKSLKRNICGGLVLTCLGGPQKKLSFKKTKNENSDLNKFFLYISKYYDLSKREFTPLTGSDERQYNSSSVDLPVGQITKTEYLKYKEYHNSLDNKKFMKISSIIDSINQLEKILFYFDNFYGTIIKRHTKFELFLSKYNLLKNKRKNRLTQAILLLTYYSDGKKKIIDILIENKISPKVALDAIIALKGKKLIRIAQ